MSTEKENLLNRFKEIIRNEFTTEVIKAFKTVNGNTQTGERKYIEKIKAILEKNNIHYEGAGSQQSRDFRNLGNIGLDIEAKMCSTQHELMFNDTCPNKDIEYI